MIGHVRGRRAFAALRQSPTRSSSGPIRITYRPPGVDDATDSSARDPHIATAPSRRLRDDASRRVAFAVPRSVGRAVVRNQARRRLRAQLEILARERAELFPPGDYLVAVRRAPRDAAEARTWLIRALRSLPVPASS